MKTTLDKTWAYLQGLWAANIDRDNSINHEARKEVEALRSLPEIVCLIGSTRFMVELEEAARHFTLKGCIVLVPLMDTSREAAPVSENEKAMLDALAFRKIELSDKVFVVNKDGYIGDSTHNEIKFAVRNEKPVLFSFPMILTKRKDMIQARHYINGLQEQVKVGG